MVQPSCGCRDAGYARTRARDTGLVHGREGTDVENRSTWAGNTNADHARIGLEALNNLRRTLRFIGDELHNINFGNKETISSETWDYMKMSRDLLSVVDTAAMLCRKSHVDINPDNWPF